MKKKSRRIWKVVGFSFLGMIVLAAAAIALEYNQLQPKNHFKSVPVVASDEKTKNKKDSATPNNSNTSAINILIMGSDARPGDKIGHSDTMMLVHVDLSKNQINAISIPRDTRVHLDGYGYTKLTSVQYILQADKGPKQGIEEAVQAISNLTGVPINYYVETNFQGLQAMVDTLGGIHMNVIQDEKIGSQVLHPGNYFLNGATVLALTRERHSLANGDYGRQMEQLEAIKGIAKEALSPGNIPKLPSLVNSLSSYLIATNMTTSDMISLGLAEKNFDPNTQLHYEQLQGVGQSLYDDILKAKNDQIVIDQQQIKDIVAKYFTD
jgi:LCP family protein required for cell wall assembly